MGANDFNSKCTYIQLLYLFYAFTETPQSSYWERQVKSQNLINSILGFLLIFNGKYVISFSSINLFNQIDC